MAVSEEGKSYQHPLYRALEAPGLSVAVGSLDQLLTWGLTHSLWVFPMATSCCGIELMAAAASRVDLDRMGTIIRGSPRQADVMVVAGTITVKMAPRVRRLWDQMPEPKWCIAMGSCAISGDFYRNVYPVVPGIDTVVPVDVYVPGCPPNPEALMQGLLQLQEQVRLQREGKLPPRAPDKRPRPGPRSVLDPERDPGVTEAQTAAARAPGDGAGRFLEELLAVPPTVEFVPQAAVGAGCGSGLHSPLTPALSQAERGVEFAGVMRGLLGLEALPTDAPPLVEASRHLELARALREAGYTLFGFVVASHWPASADGTGEQHEVAYGLRRPGPGAPLASWRVRVPVGQEVDSLCGLFAGADWQEREQFDLVGVRFRGHPDLRRLMLPDAWQGHPLRRDQPIDTPCPPWR